MEKEKALSALKKEQDDLGGLHFYQKLSQRGAKSFNAATWMLKQMNHLKLFPGFTMNLLDVGSVTPHNYAKAGKKINATYIDLNSQHPTILQMNFLDLDEKKCIKWNIICFSLVLNFVANEAERGLLNLKIAFFYFFAGEMMYKASRLLSHNEYAFLYIVLPLACITKSRYLSHEILRNEMLTKCSLHLISCHHSKSLAFYLFSKKNFNYESSSDYCTNNLIKSNAIKHSNNVSNNFKIKF